MEEKKIRPGDIVEYLQNNQIYIACVLEREKKQIKILNSNQRLVKLSISRILPWIGPLVSPNSTRDAMINSLHEHDKIRKDIEESINPYELWEAIQGEIVELDIEFAASMLWGDLNEDKIAALGRCLFKCRTHFRFEPPVFKVYSEQDVELRLKEEKAIRERKRIIEQGQIFFQALLNRKKLPPIEEDVKHKLKEIIFEKIKETNNKSIENLWKDITSGFTQNPFLPLILARNWGIIPKHYNYLLDQADYSWGNEWENKFSYIVNDIVEKVRNHPSSISRLPLVSVDSETTKDIDDAFSVEKEKNLFKVQVALACPVIFWDFNSELDHQVIHRCSSIYLPEGTAHMLPECLATELFSLHANSPKPSVILKFKISETGEILEGDLKFDWIEIHKNMTYHQVDKSLEENEKISPFSEAHELALILRRKRLENGAVILEQPEPTIKINQKENDVEVEIKDPKNYPKSQLIVSELMVLVNWFIAKWAKKNNIPLIYRTQDIVIPDEIKGVWTNPVDIYRVMKEMGPSILEISPKPHVSLGVECYSPISSPIRRYTDFINMAQIYFYLKHKRSLFTSKELEEKLPYISARLQYATKIQKFRLRYWKLLYFKRLSKKKHWHGVIVGEEGDNFVFSLPREQILLKAPKKLFNKKDFFGKKVLLKLDHIDPLTNNIKIVSVRGYDDG